MSNTRRNSSNISVNTHIRRNQKRYQTQINPKVQISNVKHTNYHNHYISHTIVNDFIYQVLLTRTQNKIQENFLKRMVDQTLQTCTSLFNRQSWQLNPNGPVQKGTSQLEHDQQPKNITIEQVQIHADKENKAYRNQMTKTTPNQLMNISGVLCQENSSKSRFKKKAKKSLLEQHRQNRKSHMSHISVKSNKSIISNGISLLVPLRIQTQRTPDIGSKRNLQDFLRDKKLSKQSPNFTLINTANNKNNGSSNISNKGTTKLIMKRTNDDKQFLQTIKQFGDTNSLFRTLKGFNETQSTISKLPLLNTTMKQQVNYEYDGQKIQLKKKGNLKKNLKVLKPICNLTKQQTQKVNQSITCKFNNNNNNNNNNKQNNFKSNNTRSNNSKQQPQRSSRNVLLKLQPLEKVKQSINAKNLQIKQNPTDQLKMLLQNKLLNNRVIFRQLNENHKLMQFQKQEHV